MRITITVLVLTLLIAGCNIKESANSFNSEDIKGKYEIDLTPLLSQMDDYKDENAPKDEWSKLGQGIASMIITSTTVEVSFYEENKGVLYLDGGAINFLNAFSEEPVQKINEFDYKIVSDSILHVKFKDKKEFEEVAVIRASSPNYDYLQLINKSEEGKPKIVNLRKISDAQTSDK